jgi:hypothetical protein
MKKWLFFKVCKLSKFIIEIGVDQIKTKSSQASNNQGEVDRWMADK